MNLKQNENELVQLMECGKFDKNKEEQLRLFLRKKELISFFIIKIERALNL